MIDIIQFYNYLYYYIIITVIFIFRLTAEFIYKDIRLKLNY